jgi:hypothetical protein
MDPVGPLTVTPGPTSSLFAVQNQPIANFNPLTVTGGYTPYTYFVSSGIIPPGLTLNSSTGVVSGTPTTVQNTAPTVFAVRDAFNNQAGTTVTVNFEVQTLPVYARVGDTTSVSVQLSTVMTSFSPFSSVSNGFGPYTYFVSSGTLPTGITLNPTTGVVSGTPTVQGSATVVFAVRDSQNNQSPTTATVTFTVFALQIQYLVVGGGGGGGAYANPGWFGSPAGGGGAGGFRQGTTCLIPGTTYTIVVGGGGASPPSLVGNGLNGCQSSFNAIISAGGGGGGFGGIVPTSVNGGVGNPGGSGGGSGRNQNAGTGTPGQGFPGGPNLSSNNGSAGGGAGGAGPPGTGPRVGGVGLVYPLTGIVYATGGAGQQAPAGPAGTGNGGGMFNLGAPGTVILAVPTPGYPGSAPPAATVSTPPAAPGQTVITFTSSSPYPM